MYFFRVCYALLSTLIVLPALAYCQSNFELELNLVDEVQLIGLVCPRHLGKWLGDNPPDGWFICRRGSLLPGSMGSFRSSQ